MTAAEKATRNRIKLKSINPISPYHKNFVDKLITYREIREERSPSV